MNNITTWHEMVMVFMHKFFSPAKIAELVNHLIGFRQAGGEILEKSWEHFKDYMRVCPHHGIPDKPLMNMFYFRLQVEHKEK